MRYVHCTIEVALSFVAVALLPSVSAEKMFRQLHVVARQGTYKTVPADFNDDDNPVLTTSGWQELYDSGRWIQYWYSQDASSNITDRVSQQGQDSAPTRLIASANDLLRSGVYDPKRVLFESSQSDVSIASASALAQAMFPKSTPVSEILTSPRIPIHSQSKGEDVTFDALELCPVAQQYLETTFSGFLWSQMEQSHMELLQKLASIPQFDEYAVTSVDGEYRYVPLQDAWKIYDIIREVKWACRTPSQSSCQSQMVPPLIIATSTSGSFEAADVLTDEEWNDLITIVGFTEVEIKYGGSLHIAQLLGGNLLRTTVARMVNDEMNRDPSDLATQRLFVSTVDHPTLIALLSLLGVIAQEGGHVDNTKAFPGFGAVLMLELYQDSETLQHEVRLLYKAPEQATAKVLHACVGQEDTCDLESFQTVLNFQLLQPEQWCQLCSNDSASACQATTPPSIEIIGNATTDGDGFSELPASVATWKIAVAFLVGFASALGLACAYVTCRCEGSKRKQQGKKADISENEMPHIDMPEMSSSSTDLGSSVDDFSCYENQSTECIA